MRICQVMTKDSMKKFRGLAALLPLSLLFLVGCEQLTPEERVEKLRSQYSIKASPFALREVPTAEPLEAEETEGAAGAETAMPDTSDLIAVISVKQDVLIDVLIGTGASETLDGLTLDVEHVDANHQLKQRYLHWVDTSSVVKGNTVQVTVVVEGVEYEEGDVFSVSLRTPVPADERSGYREFS